MNLPDTIPKGDLGWRRRKAEILVINIMGNSAKPQTVWTIRTKLRHNDNLDIAGKQLFDIMDSLYKRGYINHVGFDADDDAMYVIK